MSSAISFGVEPHESDIIGALEAAIQTRQPRPVGNEIRFLCPAHDDHDPSARWNPNKHVWCCDVCGVGGGAVDLARRLDIAAFADSGGRGCRRPRDA